MEPLVKYKKEIIISLITGVFLFYIQPALSFFGDLFISSIVSVSDSFSNAYYQAIAINDESQFASWTTYLLTLAIVFALFMFSTRLRDNRRKLEGDIEHWLHTLTQYRERLNKPIEEYVIEEQNIKKEDILKDIDDLELKIGASKDKMNLGNKRLLTLYIMVFFMALLLFSNYAFYKAVTKENNTFRNEMIKLAPSVDEIEILKLKASWASMRNKQDYEVVNETIEQLKIISK